MLVRFHQDHTAGFGEPWLAASTLAIYELQQLFIQYIIAEQVGEADNRLLYRANPLHDFSALAHELAQLLVRGSYNFLNVLITALGSTLAYVATTRSVFIPSSERNLA